MSRFTQKIPAEIRLRNKPLWMLVVAGSLVRLLYGLGTHAWLGAPDQLAWGMEIDETIRQHTWRYLQLTHAPHEGAGFLIGLVSVLFRPLSSWMPSLSMAALLIDTLSRFVQVKMAQALFGDETALWFAVWSVLSTPLFIPWATVNFGLHALLAFIPFVFCYLMNVWRYKKNFSVWMGVFCAIAVSLSYSGIAMVIVTVLFLSAQAKDVDKRLRNVSCFLAAFAMAMLPHLITRVFLYPSPGSVFSVRGLGFADTLSARNGLYFITAWFSSLPGSFWLIKGQWYIPALLFLATGVVFYLKKAWSNPANRWPPALLIVFVLLYAFSPVYGKNAGDTHYVYYRHLTYILPLFVLIVIHGCTMAGLWKKYLLAGWLLYCGVMSARFLLTATRATQTYKAAGWILAQKYDPSKLFSIRTGVPAQFRSELVQGYGWGLTARMLKAHPRDSAAAWIRMIGTTPGTFRPDMILGARYAFSKGVTPVLDTVFFRLIDSSFHHPLAELP